MPLKLLSIFRPKEINVTGTNLTLRSPLRSDYRQWVSVRNESSEFLRKWEPKWPADDLTPLGFQRRLKSYAAQRNAGTGHTFFLFDASLNRLLGGISLTKVTYGVSHSATLGYWMGVDGAGKGYMSKALPAILEHASRDLKLLRVEAACLPKNQRSIRLLEKCGFEKEGYARKYLEINGEREDHILFARLLTQ